MGHVASNGRKIVNDELETLCGLFYGQHLSGRIEDHHENFRIAGLRARFEPGTSRNTNPDSYTAAFGI